MLIYSAKLQDNWKKDDVLLLLLIAKCTNPKLFIIFFYSKKKNVCDSSHKEYNVLLINATAAAPWFLCCMYSLCWTSTSALCRPVSFKTRSNLGRRALSLYAVLTRAGALGLRETHSTAHLITDGHESFEPSLRCSSERAPRDTSLASDQSSSQECLSRSRVCHSSKWTEEDNVPFTSTGTSEQGHK